MKGCLNAAGTAQLRKVYAEAQASAIKRLLVVDAAAFRVLVERTLWRLKRKTRGPRDWVDGALMADLSEQEWTYLETTWAKRKADAP